MGLLRRVLHPRIGKCAVSYCSEPLEVVLLAQLSGRPLCCVCQAHAEQLGEPEEEQERTYRLVTARAEGWALYLSMGEPPALLPPWWVPQ
jgi:hypothetical protein